MSNFTPIDHLLNPSGAPSSVGTERVEHVGQVASLTEEGAIHEVVEHEINPEVGEFVSEHKDVIEISPDIKALGVESTGNPQFTTTAPVVIPLADDDVIKGLKAPFSSSLRWLAQYCVYILKKAHLHLKNIHGKITRVKG